MFKKGQIKKQIKKNIKEIERVEKLRYRSQAALVEAILKSEEPDDRDTDYFNTYTAQIDALRDEIHSLQKQLDEIG